MATRSTVLLSHTITKKREDGAIITIDKEKHLYHHWNGYVMGVGWELVKHFTDMEKSIRDLDLTDLEKRYGLDKSYEETDDCSNHLDREYHYSVAISQDHINSVHRMVVDVVKCKWDFDEDNSRLLPETHKTLLLEDEHKKTNGKGKDSYTLWDKRNVITISSEYGI